MNDRRQRRRALLVAAIAGPWLGPSGAAEPPVPVTFAGGLDRPWAIAFLPDGRLLVTLKGGQVVIVGADGKRVSAPLAGVPDVADSGQGGLLDVAVDPDFVSAPWVYLSYVERDGLRSGTAVARGRLVGQALEDTTVIFRQQPKVMGSGHFGSRLVFARDKTLFVTLGERQKGEPAQDLASHLGKVVRLRRDGALPPDNPVLPAGAAPGLWSWGHRNPQGAALHPRTGELWLSEHGPQGGDEINIARAGKNYGWPLRSQGCPYGSTVGDACRIGGVHGPEFVEPLTTWTPVSIAPSGLAFYTGAMFPEWQGSLFTGALAGSALWRLTLDGDRVVGREELYRSLRERIRDVRQGPDGALYLLTDGRHGRILRIAR